MSYVRVGGLTTLSDESYPGMGKYFVQIWQGDTLIARVYGNDYYDVRERAMTIQNAINTYGMEKSYEH